MKKVTIKELTKVIAEKAGLDFKSERFSDLKTFVHDIYSKLVSETRTLDEESCCYEVNVPERIVKVSTEVLKAIYNDVESIFGLSNSGAEYFDENDWELEPFDNPFDIKGIITTINYVDNKTSVSEFLAFWQKVCKEHGGQVEIIIGADDGCAYCQHDLQWKIASEKIESKNSFFEIPDDDVDSLFAALYWLTENFERDTFEDFEKLGVEIRYCKKEQQNG